MIQNIPFVPFVVESDEVVGRGGFLAIRRMRICHQLSGGEFSASYPFDYVVRPKGLDAVVVAIWHRHVDGTVKVLVRDGLRPVLWFGRDPDKVPVPETRSGQLTELVAGIVEVGDIGESGLLARAVAETREEAGFVVDPTKVAMLGAGSFPHPGSTPDKLHFVAVEVDPDQQGAMVGDGSTMEEGASTRWLDLDAAIADCMVGRIADGKTEIGLRRLRDMVGS